MSTTVAVAPEPSFFELEAFDPDEPDSAAWQYLTFTLAQEIYALGILHVIEIIEFDKITLIPMMPKCIRGVINLRGLVVPVVDLLARFGYGLTEIKARTSIIIVDLYSPSSEKPQKVGILVDAVNEVIEIHPDTIEAPPAFGSGLRKEFIAGMAKKYERFLIILDIKQVLAVHEIINLSLDH